MSTKPSTLRGLKLISKTAFNRLSIHTQRVKIAKDVLLRLELKLIRPKTGTIFSMEDKTVYETLSAAATQERFNTKPCSVCAKGALLASWIGNFDSVKGSSLWCMMNHSLAAGFPPDMVTTFGSDLLSAIEFTFEQKRFEWLVLSGSEVEALKQTFRQTTPRARLKALLLNLIANKGRLVVGDKHNPVTIG